MPRKLEMTFNRKAKRWFKKLDKKQHSVSCGTLERDYPLLYRGATEEGSYRAANQWWEERLAQVSRHPQHEALEAGIHIRSLMAQWCQMEGHDNTRAKLTDEIEHLRKAIQSKAPMETRKGMPWLGATPILPLGHDHQGMGRVNEFQGIPSLKWMELIKQVQKHALWTGSQTEDSLSKLIPMYLNAKKRSPGRDSELRARLEYFRVWKGDDKPTFSALLLHQYKAHCEQKMEAGEWVDWTASGYMKAIKSFIHWLWEMEVLDSLPRNINSQSLTIPIEEREIKTWTDKELQTLLENITGRNRLYCLLALNCGFYAGDIGQLTHKEVDWKEGRIKRGRSKTGVSNGLSFKLWPETFQLLKKYRSKHPTLALTTLNGTPLWVSEKKEGHKERKFNAIGSNFSRWKKRRKLKLPTHKTLRHTARSKLDEGQYSRYGQSFLQHKPRSVDEKHYRKPSQLQFDEALDWLRTQFKLE